MSANNLIDAWWYLGVSQNEVYHQVMAIEMGKRMSECRGSIRSDKAKFNVVCSGSLEQGIKGRKSTCLKAQSFWSSVRKIPQSEGSRFFPEILMRWRALGTTTKLHIMPEHFPAWMLLVNAWMAQHPDLLLRREAMAKIVKPWGALATGGNACSHQTVNFSWENVGCRSIGIF